MGALEYFVKNLTDVPLVTTAETVVATLTGVSTPGPGYSVRLHGEAKVTTGTTTTAITLRVRRGSAITDPLVDEATAVQLEAAIGSTEDHDIMAQDDAPGELASQTYVLTVQQTAATANGSAVNAYLRARVG